MRLKRARLFMIGPGCVGVLANGMAPGVSAGRAVRDWMCKHKLLRVTTGQRGGRGTGAHLWWLGLVPHSQQCKE